MVNLASRTARWLEPTGLAADLSRRRRPVRPGRGRRRGDRGRLRGLRLRPRDAGDHARRRPRQCLRRCRAALEARQGGTGVGRAGSRTWPRVALNLFRQTRRLPGPGAADARRGGRRSGRRADPFLGRVAAARSSACPSPPSRRSCKRVEASPDRGAPRRPRRPTPTPTPLRSHAVDTPSPTLTAGADSAREPLAAEPLAPTCTIDDFAKIDLRVARIVAAEEVPEAKKLLKLTVEPRRRRDPHRVRRHQGLSRSRSARRPARRRGREPRAAADEVRAQRGHGGGGQRRGRRQVSTCSPPIPAPSPACGCTDRGPARPAPSGGSRIPGGEPACPSGNASWDGAVPRNPGVHHGTAERSSSPPISPSRAMRPCRMPGRSPGRPAPACSSSMSRSPLWPTAVANSTTGLPEPDSARIARHARGREAGRSAVPFSTGSRWAIPPARSAGSPRRRGRS